MLLQILQKFFLSSWSVPPPFLSYPDQSIMGLFIFYLMPWSPWQKDTHRANADPHRCLKAVPLYSAPVTEFSLLQVICPGCGWWKSISCLMGPLPNPWQMGNSQGIATARERCTSVPELGTHFLPSHLSNMPNAKILPPMIQSAAGHMHSTQTLCPASGLPAGV